MSTDSKRMPRLPLVLAAAVGVAVAVTAAVVRAGGGTAVAIPGIADAGPVTAWGLPVARTVTDAAGVATVGALLLVVVLLPGGTKLSSTQLRYLNWAAAAAALWAAASVAALVLTLSDLFATPVSEIASPAVVADFVTTDAQGRSYALMVAAGGVIATFCLGIGTARWARLALLLALAGLLPPAFTGHSSAAGNHDAAVTSLALHLLGVAVWVGGPSASAGSVRRRCHQPMPPRSASATALATTISPYRLVNPIPAQPPPTPPRNHEEASDRRCGDRGRVRRRVRLLPAALTQRPQLGRSGRPVCRRGAARPGHQPLDPSPVRRP
ncbi:hypothetical protein [Streptomyces milbemycinicus]|uniref:hypothetical protein n=1 Tax=Streptomyces milbemycinicus TaxID=476552 RepID=UPI003F4CC93C